MYHHNQTHSFLVVFTVRIIRYLTGIHANSFSKVTHLIALNKHFSGRMQKWWWFSGDKLLFTTSPREAKDIGSTVTWLRGSYWETKKNYVMQQILFTKFRHNENLKNQLFDTGDITLTEAGRVILWTVGLTITKDDLFETKKWKGQNWLGKLSPTVRWQLKNP